MSQRMKTGYIRRMGRNLTLVNLGNDHEFISNGIHLQCGMRPFGKPKAKP